MKEKRPNPKELLKRVQAEEQREQRGKLKIYLGAAPGVGKTYTMLQDALAKRASGLDVVVGIVEAHNRKEITALLKNLEILPKQTINYRDKKLLEFDLDTALKRNPALILIDEMAHTNAPGLRHMKRWQDIKELLDRGTDVYTTLNVQHIESLNNVVSQIIHAPIKETVPDSMLDLADTIELVDLPPEDLLKRLEEGKVYFPLQATIAKEHFFRKGNLIALRELALRVTAERVEAQVLLYRQGERITSIWSTKEKILVCVDQGIESIKSIRTARRMAASLQAEWIAVHIRAPQFSLLKEQRNNVIRNLRLASQLGAETQTITSSGFNIAKEIIEFAREQNITQIVISKKIKPRWKNLLHRDLADEIVRQSGEIDVHIITGEAATSSSAKISSVKQPINWRNYAISTGIIVVVTLINLLLHPFLNTNNLIMIYLLGLTIVAFLGQMGPSVLAAILSILVCDFLFIPPLYSFAITDTQYFFTLGVVLLVTQIINHLTIYTRNQAETARLAEHYTKALHTLSRQLASTRGINKLLEIAVRYITDVFASEASVLLPDNKQLCIQASYPASRNLSAKEQGIAEWVYELGQMAGLGTDTLPFSDAIYLPLLASQGTIGVPRVRPTQSEYLFSQEQMHLLEACANQIALALEVDKLQERAKKSELKTETDRARNALLQAVSHDLRTPLVAIMGTASTLMEMSDELTANKIKQSGKNIYFETEQLSRLINNLLQITYLEAKEIKLQKELCSLYELVSLIITTSNKKIGKKPVHINIPKDLPKIPLDKILIQEVFINLIDNILKFTPAETPIEISAILIATKVTVYVKDRGPGIVPDEINKLFEKFYRGRMLATARGLGLGLAICRSIIKAHHGEIWAENRKNGGAAFCFTLPL